MNSVIYGHEYVHSESTIEYPANVILLHVPTNPEQNNVVLLRNYPCHFV